MRHHVDDALPHQRRQPHGAARIVGEHQERAAIGDEAAMQRQTVHRGGHAMLADAVMDVAAAELAGADRRQALGERQIGMGQVGRAADGDVAGVVDHAERHFGGLARRNFGGLRDMLGAEFIEAPRDAARDIARQGGFESRAAGRGAEPFLPLRPLGAAALRDAAPRGDNAVGHLERRVRPAQMQARGGDFLIAERRAMRLFGALQIGGALADQRLAGDEGRRIASPAPSQWRRRPLPCRGRRRAGRPSRRL